jgi:hypothetical protein
VVSFSCFNPPVKECYYPLNRKLQAPQRQSGHFRVKENLLALLANLTTIPLSSACGLGTALAQINEMFNFRTGEFFFNYHVLLASFYVCAKSL